MKYVLCIPRGGFNDSVSEIGKCWRYAEANDRKLIIDSLRSGLFDSFWNYFDSCRESVCYDADYGELNKLSTYPECIEGRLDDYEVYPNPEIAKFVETKTGIPITFDRGSTYKQDVLVHEQPWQGDTQAVYCLEGLVLKTEIQDYFKKQLEQANLEDYVAIHVRNTDYQSDYKTLFDLLYDRLDGTDVLVCSDDYRVFGYAKAVFNKSRVVRLSTYEDNNGKPLHGEKSEDQYQRNVDMLVDLLALASSSTMYFTGIEGSDRASGFSYLARSLYEKSEVRHQLLNGTAGG